MTYHCAGLSPVVDGMWKAPTGPAGTLTPIGDTDTVRLVTNDFMYTGTNVAQPGDDLLEVAVDYVTANSPVNPLVEGRIVRTP